MWVFMGVDKGLCVSMGANGSLWVFIGIYGGLWESVDKYGYAPGIDEYSWEMVDKYECVGVYGRLWIWDSSIH